MVSSEQSSAHYTDTNVYTSGSKSYSSEVEYVPEFRRRPMDKVVTLGDTVVFNVDVTGKSRK